VVYSSSVSDDEASGDVAVVCSGVPDAEAGELLLALLAAGVAAELVPEPAGTSAIAVRAADVDRARDVVADVRNEARETEESAAARARELRARAPLAEWRWLGRGTAAVAALALVLVAVFLWTTRGAADATYARMLQAGAITSARIDDGEAWRLATAVFLHFDLAHLIANVGVLVLIGPLLAHVLGPMRFAAVFVGSGIAGNAASYLFAPSPALKAGASGGVAGVLGALAGQALRAGRGGRFRSWQVLGAIAAAYALLVGAGPRSDHVAHLAGLLSGIALGHALAPAPEARRARDPLAAKEPPA